jgi:hypothetical protein
MERTSSSEGPIELPIEPQIELRSAKLGGNGVDLGHVETAPVREVTLLRRLLGRALRHPGGEGGR